MSEQIVYANDCVVRASTYELTVAFELRTAADKDATPVVTVVMSPLFAKVFLDVFARQIAAYEEMFGEIPLPSLDAPGTAAGEAE